MEVGISIDTNKDDSPRWSRESSQIKLLDTVAADSEIYM